MAVYRNGDGWGWVKSNLLKSVKNAPQACLYFSFLLHALLSLTSTSFVYHRHCHLVEQLFGKHGVHTCQRWMRISPSSWLPTVPILGSIKWLALVEACAKASASLSLRQLPRCSRQSKRRKRRANDKWRRNRMGEMKGTQTKWELHRMLVRSSSSRQVTWGSRSIHCYSVWKYAAAWWRCHFALAINGRKTEKMVNNVCVSHVRPRVLFKWKIQ